MAADYIPTGAYTYVPVLVQQQQEYWSQSPYPLWLAGQVEKESCITLKHSKCWSPYAHLKTDREEGVGFSQFTRTAKFDAIAEIKNKYPKLFTNWSWAQPFQADYQLRALVVYMRDLFNQVKGVTDVKNRYYFALSAYNGGMGGLLKDRNLCKNTKGCDPTVWFGNVEKTSFKSKTKVKGYGQSFYEINRGYVAIIPSKSTKYDKLWVVGK